MEELNKRDMVVIRIDRSVRQDLKKIANMERVGTIGNAVALLVRDYKESEKNKDKRWL